MVLFHFPSTCHHEEQSGAELLPLWRRFFLLERVKRSSSVPNDDGVALERVRDERGVCDGAPLGRPGPETTQLWSSW